MNLVEFLRARLDEDERAAKAAADAVGPDWFSGPDSFAVWSQPSAPTPVAAGPYDEDLGERAGHIARHDPARVLAEVEAKRRIIARWEQARDEARTPVSSDHFTRVSIARGELGDVLRDLATPYASHPDYRDEWKP